MPSGGSLTLKKIAKFLSTHPVWKTIFIFLPTVWTFLIDHYDWAPFSTRGSLTVIGWTISIFMLILAIVIEIVTTIFPKHSDLTQKITTLESNIGIYEHLLDSIGDVCDKKYSTLSGYIKEIEQTGKCEKPFLTSTHPEIQLAQITKEIRDCFNEITKVSKNNLVVSMAVSFPLISDKWEWVDSSNLQGGTSISELINNPSSTMYHVCKGKNFIFFNDKQEANEKNKYIYDSRDQINDNIGSIVCYGISVIGQNKTAAKLVLTIPSYGQRFSANQDPNIQNNIRKTIKDIILCQFEKRICIELSYLLITKAYREYKERQNQQQN